MSQITTGSRRRFARARVAIPTVLALVAGMFSFGVAPANAATGSLLISVVSDDGGAAIPNTQVSTMFFDGENWASGPSGSTDGSGNFLVTNAPVGLYQLYFSGPYPLWVPEAYNNSYDYQNANIYTLTAGSSTLTVGLAPAATIAGTITQTGGGFPVGGYVEARKYSPTTGVDYSTSASGTIGANGEYVISPLPSGQFVLQVKPPNGSSYVGQFYTNAYTAATATPISLTTAQHRTGFDMQLVMGATISGTVTGPASVPAAGVRVELWQNHPIYGDFGDKDFVVTNASGGYSFTGLQPGSYSLRFNAVGTAWASEWFTDQADPLAATPVVVTAAQVRTGTDAQLAAGATISGTITDAATHLPLEGYANVERRNSDNTWENIGYAEANASGNYSVTGLSAGTYRVSLEGPQFDYAIEYSGDSFYADTAEQITLAAGATSGSHDAALVKGVTIKTYARDQITRIPVNASSYLEIERTPGNWVPAPVRYGSGDLGFANVAGLPPGTYRIHWEDESGTGYLDEWWDNKPTAATANLIELAGGLEFTATAYLSTSPIPSVSPAPTPTISGVPQIGNTLTATAGTWGPAPVDLTYQWYVNGVAKPGADDETFTLGSGEVGLPIAVAVTGEKEDYLSVTKTSAATPAVASIFADVPPGATFEMEMIWMYTSGISTGYIDGAGYRIFKPSDSVTRRAMAAFLYRAAGSPVFTPPVTPSFTDVPTTDPFFAQIEWMKAEGISVGTSNGNGTFAYKPGDTVSRQAMATFLYRAAGSPAFTPPATPSFTDVPLSSSVYPQIEWMKANMISTGSSNGNGTYSYKPADSVSRQAMSAFLYRARPQNQ